MRIFTFFATLAAVGILWMAPVKAQNSDIEAVIGAQIDSFLKDDFETAFTFAAPNIKQMFRTAERFGVMVRQGYPMVHRPAEVIFNELREEDGALQQYVSIMDRQGQYYIARYSMAQVDGRWQITGVSIEKSPAVGA
ncbi:DUF4864 domain-containing protein [Neptunicoccus sediminis]|uniref:DUF4864 domain-containing protein n=1 Tax=Neptunicoccus sediminis TaxID=1892596 RepID=UPI000845DE49|nr:DUF4864 domain-containing protein [Neptunicoccus sediminis]